MANRLEELRNEIDRLIMTHQPNNVRYFVNHLYGVSEYSALLAVRRRLDPEIAATSGMLHDIYQITNSTTEEHAVKGAKVAEKILKSMNMYSNAEIAVITTAISRHSKKRKFHEPYDELLKDADVMSHCFYNTGFLLIDKEVDRFNKLLVELGVENSGLW
ncbi:MAG: HD domain-containing protein [Oscillospiraceae bacterium]|nr:HD domain-containing protein [Oscillospiraceae bacterium]